MRVWPLGRPSALYWRAQPSRRTPAITVAHDVSQTAMRNHRYSSTASRVPARAMSVRVRPGTLLTRLTFNNTAMTGGVAQNQFHSNAPIATDVISSSTNSSRVSALRPILACIKHGYAVVCPTLALSSRRAMPSSHLRRCAHSDFIDSIGPAYARAVAETLVSQPRVDSAHVSS